MRTTRMTRTIRRNTVCRVALVPLFVVICYLFQWWWLRIVTTLTLVKISAMLGVPMHRIGQDLIALDSIRVQFIIPCTMVDAFFGAIPLLWLTTATWFRNLARMGAVFAGVFLLNIIRLEAGFIALHHGAPWWLAHECVAGVAYFCLFLFIVREGAWQVGKNEAQNPQLHGIPMTAAERC